MRQRLLPGIPVVRASLRNPSSAPIRSRGQGLSDAALEAGRLQALMLPVTTLVMNLSSVALIWFGGFRIDAGQMQVEPLITFLSYFMQNP